MPSHMIIQYYGESNIRSTRRGELLDKCSKYFTKYGYNNPTMKDISAFMGIERRTLYSYYQSKADLVVDCCLYAIEDYANTMLDGYAAIIKETEGLQIRKRLKKLLTSYSVLLLRQNEKNNLMLNYDLIIKDLDHENAAFKRFIEVRNRLAPNFNLLFQVIKEGIDNGLIGGHQSEAEKLAIIIEQAFRSYVLRIADRMKYTSHYRKENIEIFIDVLINGLLKD